MSEKPTTVLSDDTQNQITQERYNELQAEVDRLRKHSETLLAEKKQQSEQRRAEKERLAEETARKKGDFETLEKQYQAKIQDLQNQIVERDKQRDENLVKSHAQKLSSQLSDNPANQEILQMVLEKRLSAKDGQISVLDTSGAVSIMTLDDLAKQIQNCGKYDSLIIGTKSCGTGSNGQSAKRAGDYSEQERLALANSNPALFNQLFLE